MKAAVYFGPRDIRCADVESPKIRADHEILVRAHATSICGSDLHLYRGTLDAIMAKGRSRTGHELVGEVVETGRAVARFKPGDRVTVPYSCSCGDCPMCRVGQTAHCEITNKAVYGFGVPFGDLNGTHAEAIVLPHADGHVMKLPAGISDEAAVTLSCNLPSAVVANRLAGIEPGDRVALIGCGPTGLMALDLALLRGPALCVALDCVPHRLELAERKHAVAIDKSDAGWKEKVLALTDGSGFDRVIEMVGSTESLAMALDLVRPGGTIAALGVFCDDRFNLNLADVFLRDISLHMNGFANAHPAMWPALRLLERGVVDTAPLFSHTFPLERIDEAFRLFDAKEDGALKMLIRP